MISLMVDNSVSFINSVVTFLFSDVIWVFVGLIMMIFVTRWLKSLM